MFQCCAESSNKTGIITFFKSSESFYQYLSTDTEISGTIKGSYTMGFTLGVKSKSISGGELQAKGSTLDLYSLKDTTTFSQDCQNTKQKSITLTP